MNLEVSVDETAFQTEPHHLLIFFWEVAAEVLVLAFKVAIRDRYVIRGTFIKTIQDQGVAAFVEFDFKGEVRIFECEEVGQQVVGSEYLDRILF